MYQISANLVHRELINATFEGKKIATSIKRPDSGDNIGCPILSETRVGFELDFGCSSVCPGSALADGYSAELSWQLGNMEEHPKS